MITAKINNTVVTVSKPTTILEAARSRGIDIPALCYHPLISHTGSCRVCIVEADGQPVMSCSTILQDGMNIYTHSPYIEELRKDVIDLILSDHPYDCMVCQKTGDCELQELAYQYGIRQPRFRGQKRLYTKKDQNPFIEREMQKCILCGRCIKVCDEVQGVGAIEIAHKGFEAKVTTAFDKDLDCEFCGQCVMVCPTGALSAKQWGTKGRYWKIKQVDSICPFCGVGCGITLHVKNNKVIRVTSRFNTGVNDGLLCVKGRFGYSFIDSPDRLTSPLVRVNPTKGEQNTLSDFKEVSWQEALDFVASKFKEIVKKHGPDAVAGLASARCTNEENYLFQKFIRAVIGTNNVDHCARL